MQNLGLEIRHFAGNLWAKLKFEHPHLRCLVSAAGMVCIVFLLKLFMQHDASCVMYVYMCNRTVKFWNLETMRLTSTVNGVYSPIR